MPVLNGKYLYLIMCLICRFMVTAKSNNQYRSKMGQNTGTSNIVNSVIAMPMQMDFIEDHLQQKHEGSCHSWYTLLGHCCC